jgi:hypothetical protein
MNHYQAEVKLTAMTRYRTFGVLFLSAVLAGVMAISINAAAAEKKREVNKEPSAEKAPATADTAQQTARALYAEGKKLYEEGKFEKALVKFTAAYETKEHPTVLKSIAECQVQIGDIAGAVRTLGKFLEDPRAENKESAEKRIEELRMTPLAVSLTSVPEGAKIAIAGEEIREVTPAKIKLCAGEHAVTFTAEGYEPLSKTLTVTLDGPNALNADFAAEGASAVPAVSEFPGAEPVASPEEPMPPMPEVTAQNGIPKAFWAMAAVTGVGLISGTVFGTMALSMEDDYKDNPTQSKKDAGQRDALIADVSFGLAAAAAIAGTVLITVHKRKSKSAEYPESAKFTVLPSAAPDNLGVGAVIEF